MDKNNIKNTRNIGIIAHIDAGKTTITERILYYTGKSHKIGEVHNGEAIMDWMIDEQERGITITSAVTSCKWKNKNIQIIDTPGHVDFTIEVERSLRILDGAIGIFCAVGGVEAQSEAVWKQADKYQIPKIVFINKIDRTGSNYFNVIKMIKKKLNANPVVLQLPVGKENNFFGIIDLIKMTQIEWDSKSLGIKYTNKKINPTMIDEATLYREKLIEQLAEYNDEIMEAYISDSKINNELLKKTIRKETIKLKIVPVLCGSALKNKGIQPLIDAIINFLPSPVDIPATIAIDLKTGKNIECIPDAESTLAALIFKISMIEGRRLSFVRIYSGEIKSGSNVFNSSRNITEKLSRILMMHANKNEHINTAGPGSIVGIIGLKHSYTGETLCNKKQKLILEKIEPKKPVISIAIEPKTHSDQEKLNTTITNFITEDPTLKINENQETGQIILSGMGELHLEIIISRMKKEFNINVNVGNPQVVHRETITKSIMCKGIFDKEIPNQHHYAEVKLHLIPLNRGKGNLFQSEIPKKILPENLINLIKQGIHESLENGTISGYPVIDINTVLIETNITDISKINPLAYKIAASIACRKGLQAANPVLLDPIMTIKILSPKNYIGEIINDLNSRKGKIKLIENERESQIIYASISLAKTFGYSTVLRSLTQGRGTFTMKFSKFDISINQEI